MTTIDLKHPARPAAPAPRLSTGRSSLLNMGAIGATFRRQLGSLLLNPLGYVYILVFVLASAAILFWPDSFYARNIADLAPLHFYMPWLLVVLLPSLTMGAWASERELGTDEQLLTLPMRPIDALLGKWFGVSAYFTLALVFSLSNVIVLAWLGRPDIGAVAANYAGWWLAGMVFASIGIFASTLVPLPALAFVVGVALCAGVLGLLGAGDWFDPFNRGLISLGHVVMALAFTAAAIGAGTIVLWARRWQKQRRGAIIAALVVFVGLCVTALNAGVIINRFASSDWDATAEKLSSLSPASKSVVGTLNEPVKVVAFISKELPPELQPKGKEVENTLKALARSSSNVRLELHRPADPLDEAGSLATQFYGLTPRKVAVDTVTGRQEQEAFLSAVVTSGSRTQRIEYFDPGLSVEYELVRAVRSVASAKKRVVGIAATDLKMMGGFDFQTRASAPRWQIVSEWEKQYDVREVNLDVPVGAEIDVLVTPQPSRLNSQQIQNLHDFIWAGRPALILEDPFPIFAGPQLATSQGKNPNPMSGMPPEPSGDLKPLLSSLGVDMPADEIVWSDFNPSHVFRRTLSPSFLWAYRDQQSVNQRPVMTGVDSLLVPFPGMIRTATDHPAGLTVTWLVRPTPNAAWGTNFYNEHVTQDPFFGMRKTEPTRLTPSAGEPPAVAVEISGTMHRAYNFPQPVPEPTTQPTTRPATAPTGMGQPSGKPIHVIFVADTDLAHDQFFEFYRNPDNRFGQEELKFLQDLRNVQFMGNAMDSLMGEEDFLELRTRRRQRRPLDKLEQVLAQTQKTLRDVEASAQQEAETKIQALRDDLQARLNKIRARPDLDDNARRQLVAQVQTSANRQLESDISQLNREADLKIRKAQIDQQRTFERVLNGRVRTQAMGIPAAVLALLAVGVLGLRMRGEQLHIPEARKRK